MQTAVEQIQTVADIIVQQLAAWGVKYVYGIPGMTQLAIVDAIRRSDSIKFILVRHEEVAAFMASAYAKLTGDIGVCLTIAGPGATNLITGLYDAKMDRAPVLALTGQIGLQFVGTGAFQEIDQHALFEAVSDFNHVIDSPEQAVELMVLAMKNAIVDGSVSHLGVPMNVQSMQIPPNTKLMTKVGRIPDRRSMPHQENIDAAVSAIASAKNPVIIAGYGAREQQNAILEIAEKIGAPVATTYKAKGLIPEDHDLALGVIGTVGTDASKRVVYGADLLLVIGSSFSEHSSLPSYIKTVQVDMDPKMISRRYPVQVGLLGDSAVILPELIKKLPEMRNEEYLEHVAAVKKQWEDKKQKEIQSDAAPVRGPQIMKALQDVVASNAIISNDVGDNTLWFARNFVVTHQTILITGYVGSMGFGLPAALSAKLAYPDRQVVCTTGDGGFTMVMGDFATAIGNDLPITVVLLNNGKINMIEYEQDEAGFPHFATDLTPIDFAEYADCCGGLGFKVTHPNELYDTLKQALSSDKPSIVDILTDPRRRW